MTISNIQKRRVINEILQKKFSEGHKPAPANIARDVAFFFGDNPLGQPYSNLAQYSSSGQRSNPRAINDSFDTTLENLVVLYIAAQEQIGKSLNFHDFVRAKFTHIDDRRQAILDKVDDYLLSIFNSDGYFFSRSDNFKSIESIDTDLSTAFVNTELGQVTIPVNTNNSRYLTASDVSVSSVRFFNDKTEEELTNFKRTGEPGALFDGLTNTHWSYELKSSEKIDVRCEIRFSISDNISDISKVGINPLGIRECQYWMRTNIEGDNDEQFGGKIVTTTLPFSFDDEARKINSFTLYVRKTAFDYEDTNPKGDPRYNYVVGFKDITMATWVYEKNATLVTNTLTLPAELYTEQTIDAVSVTVDDKAPAGSKLDYYVAVDDLSGSLDLNDYDWKRIVPLKELAPDDKNVVRFGGAARTSRMIRSDPDGSEIPLAPLDTGSIDLKKRNPSQVIVDGVDVYKVCTFAEEFIPDTLQLEEGVNTARVIVQPYDASMLDAGLGYWTDYVKGISQPSDVIYKDIRRGSSFLYGGSIGASARSVYVETFLDATDDYSDQIRDLVKSEANVKQWGLKLYLNGLEIADMPIGTDRSTVRYNFRKGLNHIAMTILIPENTAAYPNVYVGSLDLMNTGALQDYGSVRLGTIKYADFFDFKHNYTENSNVFTVYDKGIYIFKKLINNYRVSYIRSSTHAPSGVRLRVDFARDEIKPEVSPKLENYRLRFSY